MASPVGLPPTLVDQIRQVRGAINEQEIRDLLLAVTAIPSPTGEEMALAQFLVDHLGAAGLKASLDVVAGEQANVVASLGTRRGGARLMLYAALDTAFAGRPEEDEPYLGASPRADFSLPPSIDAGRIVGLGAENPKAFAVAAVVASEAIARARIDLEGELLVTLASGSMPVFGRPGFERRPLGFGSGIRHALEHGPRPDFAVVLKPGYAVSYEEVGLMWFRILVEGQVNYTGIRHKGSYRNPILAAARLVISLEDWLSQYSARHTDGLVAPQGSLNVIRAGSADRAAFVPAHCEIDLDVRVSPRSTVEAVEAELRAALQVFQDAEPDLNVRLERRIALPGTKTDPDNWIVRSLIRAWEDCERHPHTPLGRQSGATDAAILRSAGVPTARIGLPPATTPSPFAGFSMGVAEPAAVRRLAELLVYTIVDTLTRPRPELGLESSTPFSAAARPSLED